MDNSKEFQLMLDKAIESESLAFEGFDRTKNVQDQLQEMFDKLTLLALHSNFADFLYPMDNLGTMPHPRAIKEAERESEYINQFTSMEQLWLAFVIKEKYNKTWDGEQWQTITAL